MKEQDDAEEDSVEEEREAGESMVDIPEGMLLQEWTLQSGRTLRETRLAAGLRKAVADAKAALDVVKARVLLWVRKNPGKYGIEKPSEAAIAAAVTLHEKVQAAVAALDLAKFHLDDQMAVVHALSDKKTAMENIGYLDYQAVNGEPNGRPRLVRREVREAAVSGAMDELVKTGGVPTPGKKKVKKK